MFSSVTSAHFLLQARKFFREHSNLRPRFAKLITDIQNDPFAPHLMLHPLHGRLDGCHAVRLTYGYRLTLTIAISEKEIVLLDVGSHDTVCPLAGTGTC